MQLKFDENGFLFPYQPIEVNLDMIRENFVEAFKTSSTRKKIFTNFESFLIEFKTEVTENFSVWVNGSFVTKKENPNDIDLLIFINFEILGQIESKLRAFSDIRFRKTMLIDAYFIIVYPPESNHFVYFQTDKLYWQNQFSRTAKNRFGKSFEKGFLELKINKSDE